MWHLGAFAWMPVVFALIDELDQLLWSDPGAATARDARANAAGKSPPATGNRHGTAYAR